MPKWSRFWCVFVPLLLLLKINKQMELNISAMLRVGHVALTLNITKQHNIAFDADSRSAVSDKCAGQMMNAGIIV